MASDPDFRVAVARRRPPSATIQYTATFPDCGHPLFSWSRGCSSLRNLGYPNRLPAGFPRFASGVKRSILRERPMELEKVLAQLREELANLDAAILSLERLHQISGTGRRRRSPKVHPGVPEAAPLEAPGHSGEPSGQEDG